MTGKEGHRRRECSQRFGSAKRAWATPWPPWERTGMERSRCSGLLSAEEVRTKASYKGVDPFRFIPRTLGGAECRQLGEFRRCSAGEISDNGRGTPESIFVGDVLGVDLLIWSGCTCESTSSEGRLLGRCQGLTYLFRVHFGLAMIVLSFQSRPRGASLECRLRKMETVVVCRHWNAQRETRGPGCLVRRSPRRAKCLK